MSIAPGQTYGDYAVDAVIGEGGMATVARAQHAVSGQIVALKILTRDRRADVPGLRDRVHREADVLQALGGIPAVVDFLGLFEDEASGADVLVLEYVRGQTLSERYQRDQPDVRTVVEWMGLVCHAMNDIHEAGYVHRDIKPDNLLLTDDPATPLKIIDFNSAGRASTATGQLTRVQGAFPHTPAYLAPECFDGVPPDASADVYALGMTFAELLLGRHPLLDADDATQTAWHEAHENTAFPDLTKLDRRVPKVLQRVLARATAKDRSERIPDAVVLWQELKTVWDALNVPPPVKPPPVKAQTGCLTYGLGGMAALTTAAWVVTTVLWLNTLGQLGEATTDAEILQVQLDRAQAELANTQEELANTRASLTQATARVPQPAPSPSPAPSSTLLRLKDLVGEPAPAPAPVLGSALQWFTVTKEELSPGFGPEVKAGSTVEIDYTMTLLDGTPVDSTAGRGPFRFKVDDGTAIPGLNAGVKGMRPGGQRKLRIPPLMGYGDRVQPGIPANSTLSMEVTVRRVTNP